MAAKQCTCGHEDSQSLADVLRCPVHGIGPEYDSGFQRRTDEALRIAREAAQGPGTVE